MSPQTLTTIPEDVVSQILSFVCTDEGQTGRSLLRVSKSLHAFCRDTGVDLQSVAVCGGENLKKFLRNLRGREDRSRKVRAMLLSYRTSGRVYKRKPNEGEEDVCLHCYKILIYHTRRLLPSHSGYSRHGVTSQPPLPLPRLFPPNRHIPATPSPCAIPVSN